MKTLNNNLNIYDADSAIADAKSNTTLPVGIVWYWLCIDDVMTLCKHAIEFNDSDTYHELYRIECDERFKFFATSPDGIKFNDTLDVTYGLE